jgi:hypothetical protein
VGNKIIIKIPTTSVIYPKIIEIFCPNLSAKSPVGTSPKKTKSEYIACEITIAERDTCSANRKNVKIGM